MAGTLTDIAQSGELVFDTERFAAAGSRLEVAGRWRGVRGRRFVRPVLWLHAAGTRRRIVAVLDHKPWDAEDGHPWLAAFPWDGAPLEAERAQLEVGTGLVVELPAPGAPAAPRPATAHRPPAAQELAAAHAEVGALRRALEATRVEAAELRAERDRARADAEAARADGERLVNDEYAQRVRALDAAAAATDRARTADAARERAARELTAARDGQTAIEQELAAARQENERLRGEAAAARDETDRLRHNIGAADARHRRLEADLVSLRADRDRVEAELAAAHAQRQGASAGAHPAVPASRRGAAEPGRLWGARAAALALVAALLAAAVLLLAGVV